MPKIALIGAGSLVFTKTLMNDLLGTPCLRDAHFALMSRTMPKIERMKAYLDRVIEENGLGASVSATLNLEEALTGADYVIVMIQVGGMEAFGVDYEVPLKHGVDQCIGDTLGPGGIFRALRTIPPVVEIARAMDRLCPGAVLLNYSNPMAMVCWALGRESNVPFVGLCHGVQTTTDLLSGYVGVPREELDCLVAGINHMGWFLRIEHKGRDMYPVLRANIEKPGYYVNEKVRAEVMRHFGYFMTESTGHLSEYLPWFRSSERALKLYCDEPGFGGESGAYYKWGSVVNAKFAESDPLAFETTELTPRSHEYCAHIIEALETDRVFRFQGNVRNDSLITNLPDGCCVEVPCYADRTGIRPTPVGKLPPQLAALNQSNVTAQGLAVEAALTGDPELAMHALALDPLTSACLTLAETRAMGAEMLEASREWLPLFAGKVLHPTPTIEIPPDVERAEVPLDPALAIGQRFAKLMEIAERK
jgi:alpha-galactosidase